MKASTLWLDHKPVDQSVGVSNGLACLSNYTAAYNEIGTGPAIVLVPALAGGIGLVSPLAQELARHFRVVTYQLRGEEDCFALRRRFGLSDLVEDLVEFLDYCYLERPLLLGVSFGGVLAMEMAARFPERLSGLIVQGADVRFKRTMLRLVAGHVLSGYPLPPDSPFVNQFFNLLFGCRQKNAAVFDFVTRQSWQTDQSVMAHRFQMAEKFDLAGRMGRITAPTLLISGARDLLVSVDGLKELCAGISHADLASLPDAGHLAFVTHAQEMAETIARFAQETQANDLPDSRRRF